MITGSLISPMVVTSPGEVLPYIPSPSGDVALIERSGELALAVVITSLITADVMALPETYSTSAALRMSIS